MDPVTQQEFNRVLLRVVIIGVGAFLVSGGLIVAFFNSLQREDRDGARRMTTRSVVLLVLAIVSLMGFSFAFAILSYVK